MPIDLETRKDFNAILDVIDVTDTDAKPRLDELRKIAARLVISANQSTGGMTELGEVMGLLNNQIESTRKKSTP